MNYITGRGEGEYNFFSLSASGSTSTCRRPRSVVFYNQKTNALQIPNVITNCLVYVLVLTLDEVGASVGKTNPTGSGAAVTGSMVGMAVGAGVCPGTVGAGEIVGSAVVGEELGSSLGLSLGASVGPFVVGGTVGGDVTPARHSSTPGLTQMGVKLSNCWSVSKTDAKPQRLP